MHIQIINFNLDGIGRSEYDQVCDDLVRPLPMFPGLSLSIGSRMMAPTPTAVFMPGNPKTPMRHSSLQNFSQP